MASLRQGRFRSGSHLRFCPKRCRQFCSFFLFFDSGYRKRSGSKKELRFYISANSIVLFRNEVLSFGNLSHSTDRWPICQREGSLRDGNYPSSGHWLAQIRLFQVKSQCLLHCRSFYDSSGTYEFSLLPIENDVESMLDTFLYVYPRFDFRSDR